MLGFDAALDMVVTQLQIPSKQHREFISDATDLANWINTALKVRKSMFAGSLTNLPATATYMSGNVVDIPNNFNCYLLVELRYPFYIEMKKDYIYLHSEHKKKLLGESIIPSVYLQNHLRDDLYTLLAPQPRVDCSERSYKLCYHTTLYPISAHTIIATRLRSNTNTRIIFEFLVGIKLPKHLFPRPGTVPLPESMPKDDLEFWVALAVPHFDVNFNAHSFLGRCHIWQAATTRQRQDWCLVVRLFYLLAIGNGTLGTISIHALKHTCINICEKFGLEKADRSLSFKLMDTIITHGTLKLNEITCAFKSEHIMSFDSHPTLSSDCARTDVLLAEMRSKMQSENGVDLAKFQLLFGIMKQSSQQKRTKATAKK